MRARPTVNVITPHYAFGLAHSGRIVASTLRDAGFRTRFLHFDDGRISRVRQRLHRSPLRRFLRRDVNIFMEQLSPRFFDMARFQLLIPNQEWMRDDQIPFLREVDLVVCKSRHAEEIFSGLGLRTAFSSFTSRDRRLPGGGPKRREFFLMLGNRPLIAGRVIGIWARHPEWPRLTVSSLKAPEGVDLPNVRVIRDFLPEDEIVRLQNAHLFHLCITAAEGFGHKLNEAMACGAVAITTDGPPMNELIRPERGLLVKWTHTTPKSLGADYHFDETHLEQTIEQCLRLTPAEINTITANARRWFEENDRFFRGAFPQIVRNVSQGSGHPQKAWQPAGPASPI